MTDPIDIAHVEIRPDVKDFARDTRRELDRSFNDIELKLDHVVDSIEGGFDRLITILDAHFDNLVFSVDNAFDRIQDDARDAARTIATSVEAGTESAKRSVDDLADKATDDLDRIDRSANRAGRGIARMVFSGAMTGIKNFFDSMSELGGNLRNIIAVPASIAGVLGTLLKFTLIAAAIPVILGLAGAIVDLVGALALLPALAGVAVAAIAPLIIAFMGMGEAISAVASGDLEKIDEALKNLSPSARLVAKEIGGLIAPLKDLKKFVQESFFAPLVGQIRETVTQLLPMWRTGMTQVASAFGNLGKEILILFRDNDIMEDFGDAFESAARIITQITPPLVDLMGTLIGVMEHGLPFVERIFAAMGRGMEKFSNFLGDAMKSGEFEGWLERAFSVMKDLWNVTKAFGNVLMALVGDAGDEGQGFLRSITDALNRFANFLRSDEGKEALQRMLDGIKLASVLVAGFFLLLANLARFSNFINDLFIQIKEFFTDSIPNAFNKSMTAIGNFFSAIGSFFSGIGRAIMGFLTTTGGAILGFFQALPGRVLGFLMMLPGLVIGLFDSMLHQTAFNVGMFVGIIVGFFAALPGRIAGAFTTLINLITTTFFRARDNAIATVLFLVNTIVGYFQALPGRMAAAASTLWSSVVGAFNALRDGANRVVTSTIQGVVNLIRSLRTRIPQATSDAGSWLYNAGRNMIQGLVNGITDLLGWAVNKAKSIAKSIADGFKKGLGIGSPSKVMYDEVGRWILPGAMKAVDDDTNDMMNMIGRVTAGIPAAVAGGGGGGSTTNSHTESNVVNGGGGAGNITVIVQLGDEVITNPIIKIIDRNAEPVALAVEKGNTLLSRRR